MKATRREFLGMAGAGVAASLTRSGAAQAATPDGIAAVAFDGFPILDPRPVFRLLEELAPGRGPEVTAAMRGRLFEYQWLRALGRRYVPFPQCLADAFTATDRALGLGLGADARDRVVETFGTLAPWPDAKATLQALRAQGIRTAFLSNMTPDMLEAGIRNGGLEGLFDAVLSTDAIRSYKPDPRAYALAVDAFGLPTERIAFAAFASWDVAGATWFGYPTVWINRTGAPAEELGARPVAAGPDLSALLKFVSPDEDTA